MLKSLELAGFKSFADKTRFEFLDGITVVVGPNGSGKSNVVDALKWILGTQSPRSLRGKEMTDVIFNGSASRGPMNMAEATLSFSNPEPKEGQRRLFDLDELEVRLTRRVYRSGEGEYLINGQACRLRDFRELLAGTGIGMDSYSVIEQGKVDAALNASPHERRLLFEEAAGISRFRLKKREAAKRLERVEQNLLRLSDIVDEVEGRLKRVRSQAGKAQKYRDQTNRLREVRIQLAKADWQALSSEWSSLDEQHAILSNRLEEARTLAQEQEEKLAGTEEDKLAAEKAHEAEDSLARIRDAVSRDESLVEFEQSRSVDLASNSVEQREALLKLKRDSLRTSTDEDEHTLSAAEETAIEYDQALEEAAQRSEESESLVSSLNERLTHSRETLRQITAKVAEFSREEHRIKDRLAANVKRATESKLEIEQLLTRAQETSSKLQEVNTTRQSTESQLREAESRQAELTTRLVEDRKQLAASHQLVREHHAREVETRHRLESLAAEEQRLEKLNQDIQTLVAATPDSEQTPEVFGLVADLIQVDVDLATLVEAALEGKTHHVVVDSGEAILAAHQKQGGAFGSRAPFQRLDWQAPAAAVDRVDLSAEPGVMGRADDFVEADPKFSGLLQRLLGRTWFVDTSETANRLSKSVGRGLTFVTYAGEVISSDGTLLVGPREDRDGVLTRRRRAAQLRADLAKYDQTRAEAEKQVALLQESVDADEKATSEVRNKVEAIRKQATEAAQQTAALEERSRQLSINLQRGQQKVQELSAGIKKLSEELAVVEENHSQAAAEEVRLAQEVEVVEKQLKATEAVCVSERARVIELTASVERHSQLLNSLRQASLGESGAATLLEDAFQALRVSEQDRLECERRILQASARIA